MLENASIPRLGFHYYPDTTHYREKDLNLWLPRLKRMGGHWITLLSSPQRAIPEAFLRGLLNQNITPIIHMCMDLGQPVELSSLRLLFDAYAKWGVRYLALFDRPNNRQSWKGNSWTRSNLVEQFLDLYIPLAQATCQAGLSPVFPPLEPGGDYWDTVFLQTALRGMQRRGYGSICAQLTLGAYAWMQNHPLHWGAGGPGKWPASHPYHTPADSEDQLGFHIYEWYQAQAVEVLQHPLPVILLGAGCRMQDCITKQAPQGNPTLHRQNNLEIYKQLAETSSSPDVPLSIPDEVIACNFWLLACEAGNAHHPDAWFPEDQLPLPVVDAFVNINNPTSNSWRRHYVLLPEISWIEKDCVYQSISSQLNRQDLIFGCSVEEALHAHRVTIIGNTKWIAESEFQKLVAGECMIEEWYGNGTQLASKLLTL